MTKPLPEDFSSIAEEASRLQRIKTYKMQNPEGSQLRRTLAPAAIQSIDNLDQGDARNTGGTAIRYTWEANCQIEPFMTTAPQKPADPKPVASAPNISADDINALASWAVDHCIIGDYQAPRFADQILDAYRASLTVRTSHPEAPFHLRYQRTGYSRPRIREIAHAINVTCRETDYLAGTIAHKALPAIIAMLSRMP